MKTIYKRFTKRTLLLFLFIHFFSSNFAATYYVSNSGNDSNSGLATTLAWKTLAKVNASIFNAGDQILFRKGDSFYGTITVKNSGTAGSPIIYGAYGTGANPVISGFTTISGWTNEGGGIYSKAVTAQSDTTNIVTVNGVNTAMGRWPNTGYMTYESHSGNTSITDNQLTGTPNWTGDELVLRRTEWTLNRNVIKGHSGSKITYTAEPNTWDGPSDGYGYFIQNGLNTLDVLGEWYYNGTTLYMYFGANDPTNYIVKISTLDNLISSGATSAARKHYITVDNITFEGSTINAIFLVQSTTNWTIQNCVFNLLGKNGIYGWATSYLTVNNNVFDGINNNAIANLWANTNQTISNNVISNIGTLPGMGASDDNSYDAIQVYCSKTVGGTISVNNNTIQHIGHTAIRAIGKGITINKNIISDFGLVKSDVGGIYLVAANTTTISDNILSNSHNTVEGIGSASSDPWIQGIYLDNTSHDIKILGNTVFDINGDGIGIQSSYNVEAYNNTVYACTHGQLRINSFSATTPVSGINIHNNILVAKTTGSSTYPYYPVAAIFETFLGDINTWGTLDNNYYGRPIDDDDILRRMDHVNDPWNGVGLTLAQWKTYSGQDANSQKSPQTITSVNDLQFEYNATNAVKTMTLSQPMIDVKGTKYASSVTLQPFTSVVLMKDLTASVVPSAPTSVVATAGNASASVTFVAPISNGGSVITGYTVTSIPTGGIDSNAGSTSLTHTITGLTNGTSYTFTVKATNSVGTSAVSVASNSVIPKAPVATAFLFTGPSSGSVNSASSNFTVTPNNPYTGTITITPSGTGSAGLSAKVLTFSGSSTAQTFAITPAVSGGITLTPTNNGTLSNPANITYNVNAVVPNAPMSVVAASGDASASVSFMAPSNMGGSPITGYIVTSSPAGGIDINAGSTSLTHTITGLANGTYTFTVKATNSVGSSVASVASNPIENIITKQGEIIPSHFTTVWQGLNGLNHMNIIVASATLEDLPLSVNDEIAVFSGSACVGTAKLTKSIVPSDNTSFLTILASQSDGSTNGFIDNDSIIFKVWNNTNKVEIQINGAVYRNDVPTWKTNGRYTPGSTAMVEITSYKVYTQSIELLKGYNMISTYVSAQNPNVSAVTKTLLDQGNLIKIQDETGSSFENWGTFGGWINQLGSLEETEGYKIQVANNCTLQVTGRPIAMPFDISLKTGWNIISFPRTDVVNAINVVQGLIDQNKLVKVQDEAGNSIENWGLFGGWKNGIGNFIPGKAYKVKMSADAILTLQASYPKSALIMAKTEQTEYYHSSVEGNGTDHMNINLTGLNNIGLSPGDELAAFDGAVCVATTKITEANLLSGSASLASSFSTDNQNLNGFKVGNPIQISAWSRLSGDESKVNAEVLTGQLKYEKNASVLVKMKSATITTGLSNLDNRVKIDVFPNPCQGRVTVRFSEIPEGNSQIEISDLSGRKLISRIVSGTSESFDLDSFTPGLYLVKSILGKNEYVQKLIVNK